MKSFSIYIILTLIFSSTLFGAKSSEQGSINGAPFQALNTLIENNTARIAENASLISANSDAISANALSIEALEKKTDEIGAAILGLEERVATNEIDIAALKNKVNAISTDLESLSVELNQLSVSVSGSINEMNQEIATLKDSVNALSSNLDTLRVNVDEKISELDAAIASNSGDITVLSALVVSMNAKLTLANSDITALYTKISSLESMIASQNEIINDLDARLLLVNTQNTATLSSREFTVRGTQYKDLSIAVLKSNISALNYLSGEYFYMKATGKRNSEFCSSNPFVMSIIDSYISSIEYSKSGQNMENVWVKGEGASLWSAAYHLYAQTISSDQYNFLDFYAVDGSFKFHRTILMPKYYDQDNMEVFVNGGWDNDAINSITVRVGATRMEACGF